MNEGQLLDGEAGKADDLVRRLRDVYGSDLASLLRSGEDERFILKSLILGLLRILPLDARKAILSHDFKGMLTCALCGTEFKRRSNARDQYFCDRKCRSKMKRRVQMRRLMRRNRAQAEGRTFSELYPGL